MTVPVTTGDLISAADWNAVGGEITTASTSSDTGVSLSWDASVYRFIHFLVDGTVSAAGVCRLRIGATTLHAGTDYRSSMNAWDAAGTVASSAGGESDFASIAYGDTTRTVIQGVLDLKTTFNSFTCQGFGSSGTATTMNFTSIGTGILASNLASVDIMRIYAPSAQTWTSVTARAWGQV